MRERKRRVFPETFKREAFGQRPDHGRHPGSPAIAVGDRGRSAGEVRFITGQAREGEVSFVAEGASPETRTFLAETIVET